MPADCRNYPTRSRWRRRGVLTLLGFTSLLLLLILGDLALAHNRIHPGVTILGHEVGRQTREEASAALQELVDRAARAPLTLAGEGQSWEVLPADLGTAIDVQTTVAEAYGLTRNSNFASDLVTRFSLYMSPQELPVRATIDAALMDDLLRRLGEALDKPPVNASLKVEGQDVSVVEGTPGLVVDQAGLRESLKTLLFSLEQAEVPIPTKRLDPAIQASHTEEAAAQARAMMTGPVELRSGENSWTLSPETLRGLLDFRVEGEGGTERLVTFISAEKAGSFFDEVAKAVNVSPKNATWETNGTTASIVPAVTGKTLDREKTAVAVTEAARSSEQRLAQVQAVEAQPDRTTERAKEMGIASKLGAFTTEFGGSDNRRDNVQHAAKLISGTLIGPGEEFDFDRVVGQRTTENGFKTAPAIISGRLEDTLGGGICQVATTLFNAAFFAGLDITSRRNHSLYISHYPKGRDATVSWGGPAFRFRNDTSNWILIKAASSRSSLTFVIYGTPQGREVSYTTSDWYNVQPPTEKRVASSELTVGQTRVTDDGQTGRSIKVVRKVTREGKIIHEDNFVSTYPMRPKVIQEGTKPLPTTTTTEPKPVTTTSAPAPATTTSTSTTTAGQ
jgi:vancomycin resistance protein YoaR